MQQTKVAADAREKLAALLAEVRAESHSMEDPGVAAVDRARALYLRGRLQEATSGLSEATSGPSDATDADAVRIANTKLNLAEVGSGRY